MNRKQSLTSTRYLVYRYVQALDKGDLNEVEMILQAAQQNSELDHMIREVNAEYASELGLTPLAKMTTRIQELLEKYFVQDDEIEYQPLTVGDVAARMAGDQEIPKAQREISKELIENRTILPEWLSIQAVRQIGAKLKLLDERFLRAFRDTALQMMMGRGQAQMAATRAKRSHRTTQSNSNIRGKGKNNDRQ